MEKRGRAIQWLMLLFILLSLCIPIGDGYVVEALIEFSSYVFNPTSWYYPYTPQLVTIPFYLLFIIILLLLILMSIKKTNPVLLKIISIIQFLLFIPLLLAIFGVYDFTFVTSILITFSLLQVVNVFSKTIKRLRLTFIIATSLCIVGLGVYSVLFWTVSRFEFELNEDGESYSIVSIESDIPTIRIPSTYKGLPVTKINSNYYIYQNIQEIIFEEDSNIEIIEQTAFRCRNLRKITLSPSLHTVGDNAFSFCYKLEEVIIPIEVIYIGGWVFECENGIIYCEAESKPDTWEVGWCYKAKEIIWGYGG
jgi:hypothetical protein